MFKDDRYRRNQKYRENEGKFYVNTITNYKNWLNC